MAKVKRSALKTFVNTTPDAEATYALMGEGITTATINMNPQTEEETYIHQDVGVTDIVSFRPSISLEASYDSADNASKYFEKLYRNRAVLDEAITDIVNVFTYEAATAGAYPAEKQIVAIAIETFGGDGGQKIKVGGTIYYQGGAVKGTFNPETGTFTATVSP